jgi:hypothetical protein
MTTAERYSKGEESAAMGDIDDIRSPAVVNAQEPSLQIRPKEMNQRESQFVAPDAALPVKVPFSKRRGLLGRFTLIGEVENSRTFPRWTKWLLTCIVSFASLVAPMGSSIFFREWPAFLTAF